MRRAISPPILWFNLYSTNLIIHIIRPTIQIPRTLCHQASQDRTLTSNHSMGGDQQTYPQPRKPTCHSIIQVRNKPLLRHRKCHRTNKISSLDSHHYSLFQRARLLSNGQQCIPHPMTSTSSPMATMVSQHPKHLANSRNVFNNHLGSRPHKNKCVSQKEQSVGSV